MSPQQYSEAVAARQRDREAQGIVRRVGQAARLLHNPEAPASWYLSPAYLQGGLNDGRARAPKLRAVWLEEQKAMAALTKQFRERMAPAHRRVTGCTRQGCSASMHGTIDHEERDARGQLLRLLSERKARIVGSSRPLLVTPP
jgi:hypothetical protein